MEGLKFFGTLSILTIIISVLLFFIWKRYRNLSVILGIAMIYYWSLAGAWFIIYDQLTSDSSIRWGVHYHYYFQKLFHIILNNDYLLSILAYGIFIIVIQISLLLFPIKNSREEVEQKAIWIYHPALISIAWIALFGSIFFNYDKIIEAINFGESIYVYTRLNPGPFFSFHQLCNEIAVCTLLMGMAILISGNDCKFIKGKWSMLYLFFYILSFTVVMLYLVVLGNKHDLLFGGLLGLFLLYENTNHKIKPGRYFAFVMLVAIPLFATDTIRSIQWGNYFESKNAHHKVHDKTEPLIQSASGISMIQNIVFNDEMFAAHMSMYGAIHNNISVTNGSSVVSLVASFIPRVIWKKRPEDIYPYYANGINYHDAQGFTIHHATGWYLNFGWIGIFAGAFLFGWIWFYGLKNEAGKWNGNNFKRLLVIMIPISIPAFIPLFIRAGVEVYKPLLIEGIIIPVIMLWIASLAYKKLSHRNNE